MTRAKIPAWPRKCRHDDGRATTRRAPANVVPVARRVLPSSPWRADNAATPLKCPAEEESSARKAGCRQMRVLHASASSWRPSAEGHVTIRRRRRSSPDTSAGSGQRWVRPGFDSISCPPGISLRSLAGPSELRRRCRRDAFGDCQRAHFRHELAE